MGFPPQDFKSCVSTSSTTSANAGETLKATVPEIEGRGNACSSLEAVVPVPFVQAGRRPRNLSREERLLLALLVLRLGLVRFRGGR
jgi:hypothetical protein